MSDVLDLNAFVEAEKRKLFHEKLLLDANLKVPQREPETSDLTLENIDVRDVKFENSKVVLDDRLARSSPRSPLSDLNETPSRLCKSPHLDSTGLKSALGLKCQDEGLRSSDTDSNMSSITRYSTNSRNCKRTPSEGVSSISALGAEYELRKRELLLARNKEYKEYLAKQKLLEKKTKHKRKHDIEQESSEEYIYNPEFSNAISTQTALGNKFDRNSKAEHSNGRGKCSIAVQTEPIRSLKSTHTVENTPKKAPCRNRSLDLISIGGGDSHDWETEAGGSERVTTRRQNDLAANKHPKAVSKRRMIEQLRSSYYPSFGDCFESPEERKIRLAKEEARKREIYQKELSEQIREKRLEMEAIKRKELEEEEALARRLEAQIQNMQMERDLELLTQENRKEKMRKNTIQFNERKKQLQLEVEQEKEKLRQARKSCPHNSHRSPSTSVTQSRVPSPPIPALKNRQPAYSTNIEEDSIFAKSHNQNTDSLAEQIRKLNSGLSNQDGTSVYKKYEGDKDVSENFAAKVGSWEVRSDFRNDRANRVRRSVSDDGTSCSRSNSPDSDYYEETKQSYSETSINRDKSDAGRDANSLTRVLSDENYATRSILTQLGAIRRQLQMTQIELDDRLSKS